MCVITILATGIFLLFKNVNDKMIVNEYVSFSNEVLLELQTYQEEAVRNGSGKDLYLDAIEIKSRFTPMFQEKYFNEEGDLFLKTGEIVTSSYPMFIDEDTPTRTALISLEFGNETDQMSTGQCVGFLSKIRNTHYISSNDIDGKKSMPMEEIISICENESRSFYISLGEPTVEQD